MPMFDQQTQSSPLTNQEISDRIEEIREKMRGEKPPAADAALDLLKNLLQNLNDLTAHARGNTGINSLR